MLNNLDWLHDLDIAYDASTFDTDPFEPQPDGVGTIFPYWIPGPCAPASEIPNTQLAVSRPGYVELPYTLPQDSSLFLLFRVVNDLVDPIDPVDLVLFLPLPVIVGALFILAS